KTAAFRAGGVPVPEHTTTRDLDRLADAIARTGAERLVVLGDLLHARTSTSAPVRAAFTSFRAAHAELAIVLVRGNHDRTAGDPPAEWRIDAVDPGGALGPFTVLHEPGDEPSDRYDNALAGHIHPAVRLLDPGTRSGVRMPCFWRRSDCLILPSFGSFTGTHVVRPRRGDAVHVCAGDAVHPIPT
ncbi:MAG: ligase-associated DNA damage response endonuclease PdeM, partial [Planctomycetota bacterium]